MKKSLDMNQSNFHKYISTRDHYFHNMESSLKKKNYRKASELLWGAITQAIKALASLSNITIRSHNFFRTYTREIAKEINDSEYHELFLNLQILHQNFYDEQFDPVDFPIYHRKALLFLEKNDELIKKKLEALKI